MTIRDKFIRKQPEGRAGLNPQRRAMVFAACTAFAAVVIGSTLLFQGPVENQSEKIVTVEVPVEVETVDVVVAQRNVAYNEPLKRSDLKIVKWPKGAKPANAYENIDALFSAKGDRYFTTRMMTDEVILPTKLTEPGTTATLATLLNDDTRAVAVRVDDVLGVAGFVRPGDFVDVILTRSVDESETQDHFSLVLLQKIHVLGVDQTSQVTSDPTEVAKRIAKTVTLEVDLIGAQKLALAGSVGRLSLALRRRRGSVFPDIDRVSVDDLGFDSVIKTQAQLQLAVSTSSPVQPARRRTKTIGVTRAVVRVEEEVIPEADTASE